MSAGVVIVGAGQGGLQAAVSLREEGYQEPIVLVGDEPDLPYQRPPLSKAFLLGDMTEQRLHFRPQEFFAKSGIDFRPGAIVTALDRAGRAVTLDDGGRLAYDHLILATGARNRKLHIPGHELDQVVYLRTLQDARELQTKLDGVENVVVIGAGFIGLEFAAVAAKLGRKVRVVEAAERIMGRAVSIECSTFFQAKHQGWGTVLHLKSMTAAIEGTNGRVTGVRLSGGTVLPAELVVVGIGVLPNAELAEKAGLAVSNGIVVNEFLATADPAVSAIGDCAVHPNPYAGGPIRVESVQNAIDQAKTVAARILGKPQPYRAVPWFWSDQGDVKLQIAGIATGYDRAVVQGDPAEGRFSIFCFRHGRLVGVESVNKPADHLAARRILAAHGAHGLEELEAKGFDLKAIASALPR